MPAKNQDEDQHSEDGVRIVSPSTDYSQPWWHRIKGVTSSFGESNGIINVGTQLPATSDGVADDTNFSTAILSGLNVNNAENQHQVKHVEINSPTELVGRSIAMTTYPYQDPHYAGMMNYVTPACQLAHPQYFGIHQTRMQLPLQMEEEPVYVNAKQYHGILRRRQSRAKAELEKKVIKSRKPYLHESRHQHAIKRARGCGGRFLNTKNLNTDATADSSHKKESKSGQHMSDSDHMSTNYSGNNNDHQILSSSCNFNLMDREGIHYFKRDMGNMVNQFP